MEVCGGSNVCKREEGWLQVQQVAPGPLVSHSLFVQYPAACPACFQLFKRAGLVWAGFNPGMDRPASLEGESKGSEMRWPTPQPWGRAWRGDLRASLSEQKKQGCSHLVLVQLCLQRPRLKSQLPWGGSGRSPELFVCWQSCQAPHGEFFLFAHKSCPW